VGPDIDPVDQARMTDAIVEYRGISKYFAGIRALENVDFACKPGSIHAILGENGAGKSTLIKIMSGVLQPDAGEMRLEGKPVAFATPQAANEAGIVCMFQELSLVPDLSVADNISISDPPRRFGLIDRERRSGAPRNFWRVFAARMSIPTPWCANCFHGARWSRSPRRWPQIPESPDPGRGDLGVDRARRPDGLRPARRAEG
jgi:hypothetical protein